LTKEDERQLYGITSQPQPAVAYLDGNRRCFALQIISNATTPQFPVARLFSRQAHALFTLFALCLLFVDTLPFFLTKYFLLSFSCSRIDNEDLEVLWKRNEGTILHFFDC
jgi:hypothetical protein